jgi:L-asparaginase
VSHIISRLAFLGSVNSSCLGTLVVMNGHINAARDVTKTHTSQVETFRSLEFGPLGVVDQTAVRFYRKPVRRQTFDVDENTNLPRVEIVTNYAGADGLMLRSAMSSGKIDAVVIAGLGLGGVSSAMFDEIDQTRRKGVPIVVSTRVPTGRVFALSATKGSPLALRRIGCVWADNLSPKKARVLLMLDVLKTRDSEQLQRLFEC